MVAGELERGRWGQMTGPPREVSRCFKSYSGPDESIENASSGSPPSGLAYLSLTALPSTPTRRQGRGTSHDTSPRCPSLIPRRRWARTPELFGLRHGPPWNKGFEGRWARLRLPKLFDHRLDGGTKKLGRRETGASRRKPFSFFPISARFTHRCLSVTTMAAIDLPIAVAACLVARRAKSVVRRSSATSSGDKPWPLSRSFSRSAWYAWSTAILCNEATAWPAASYALPFKRDVSWRGLDGKEGALREDVSPTER